MKAHIMMVHCPNCATRHVMPEARLASGSLAISCKACGHRWTEVETIDVIEVPQRNLPRVIDHDDAPELEARRLAQIAREAERRYRETRARRQRSLRNWAAFGVFLLAPVVALALFPERVVSAAPVTFKAYEKLGYDINIYGLDVRRVERQHAVINGTRVLSVKGDIVNISDDQRKLPWLRFALEDDSGKELYSWTLDTAARPLRPGESTAFTTRVQAPPETSTHLKIRFAKADEIGSNGGS
jgi:predicted Zn finger-like uncharacterized protein